MSVSRRVALLATLLWTVGLVVGGPITTLTVWAQEAIECAPTATPAAGTAATTPAAAAGTDAVAFPAEGGELTVFAAASLTEAFDQIKADLEAANPGLTITYNFAGSQVLVTQLAEGAEADVFASADTRQMAAAQEQGLIAGEPAIFVRNRLAVVVPADNPAAIESAGGPRQGGREARPGRAGRAGRSLRAAVVLPDGRGRRDLRRRLRRAGRRERRLERGERPGGADQGRARRGRRRCRLHLRRRCRPRPAR